MKTSQAKIGMKKVEVTLPVVRLQVEDLGYLQGLTKDSPCKCIIPDKNAARLRVLGLIEDYEVPPCAKKVLEFKSRREDFIAGFRAEAKREPTNWATIARFTSSHYQITDSHEPRPTVSIRITKEGLALIKTGTAQVQIKGACK